MASLLAILGLDTAPFSKSLGSAVSQAKAAGREIGTALGEQVRGQLAQFAGVFAIGSLIKSAEELAGNIHRLSAEYRVSTDEVQRWDIASRRVGLTADDIGSALIKLKKNREAALAGGPEGDKLIEAWGRLGISAQTLRDSSIETNVILAQMAEHVGDRAITDQEDAASMELIGRAGAKTLSAFKELKDLGPITLIDKKQIDDMHRMQEEFEITKREVDSSIISAINWMARAPRFMGSQAGAIYSFLFDKGVDLKSAKYGAWHWQSSLGTSEPGGGGVGHKQNVYTATKIVDLHKDDAEIEKLRMELSEKILSNRMKQLTAEQKRVELAKQIKEHEKKAIEYEFGEGDDAKALQEKIKAEELRGELASIKGETKTIHGIEMSRNEAQQAGAYSAANQLGNQSLDVAKQSEKHLADIRSDIQRLNKLMERNAF